MIFIIMDNQQLSVMRRMELILSTLVPPISLKLLYSPGLAYIIRPL